MAKKARRAQPRPKQGNSTGMRGAGKRSPERTTSGGTQPARPPGTSNLFVKPPAAGAVTGPGLFDARVGAPVPSGSSPLPSRRKAETPRIVIEERSVPPHSCATGALAEAEQQGLAATYTFDTSEWTETGPVAIGFTGTRLDGSGAPGDRFERTERLGELGPRTGKVAITTRLDRVTPGQWRIEAGPVENPAGHPLPRQAITTSSQFALLAQGPGVRLLAWPALVGLGAVVALIFQVLLVAGAGLPALPVLGLTGVACLIGFLGGKVWWLVANRRPARQFLSSGACIQGFLLAALMVLMAGAWVWGLPAARILDLTAPGIFIGMAVGRPGCFLTGCCAGRPTTTRWGLWASDRRLAIRRIPVQLYEAAAALLIGLASLVLVLEVPAPFSGAVFAGSFAAYTLARQYLFRLRHNSHTRLGRLAVEVVCGAALLGVMAAYLAA